MNLTIAELVNKLPDPDKRGFMSNIDKNVVDDVAAAILKGGPENIVKVIDMLTEPGGDDYKAHYALHCMAIRVGNKRRRRRMLSKTIAGQLDKDHPKAVKKYLIRELQVVGGGEVVATLEKLLGDENLGEPARQALAAIQKTV